MEYLFQVSQGTGDGAALRLPWTFPEAWRVVRLQPIAWPARGPRKSRRPPQPASCFIYRLGARSIPVRAGSSWSTRFPGVKAMPIGSRISVTLLLFDGVQELLSA